MFDVNGTTITLSRGDTGALCITAVTTRKDTGEKYNFGPDDRAVFSIQSSTGDLNKDKYALLGYTDDGDWIPTNEFVVVFNNKDTDELAIGNYVWDVRFVINPYYNEYGRIVDGDQVLTPNTPMTMSLLNVVGEI